MGHKRDLPRPRSRVLEEQAPKFFGHPFDFGRRLCTFLRRKSTRVLIPPSPLLLRSSPPSHKRGFFTLWKRKKAFAEAAKDPFRRIKDPAATLSLATFSSGHMRQRESSVAASSTSDIPLQKTSGRHNTCFVGEIYLRTHTRTSLSLIISVEKVSNIATCDDRERELQGFYCDYNVISRDRPTGGAFLRAFGWRHCYLSAGEEEGLSFLFVDLPPQAPPPPAIKVFSPPSPPSLENGGLASGTF